MGKVDCGQSETAHPLFRYLQNSSNGWLGRRILWNFTKFLCDSNGVPLRYYFPNQSPLSFEKDIQKLISEHKKPAP